MSAAGMPSPLPPPPAPHAGPDAGAPMFNAPEFRIGGVVSRSFSFLFGNFVSTMLVMTVVFAPLIIWTAMLALDFSEEQLDLWVDVAPLYTLFADLVAGAALIHGVFHHLRGKRVSFRANLLTGLRCAMPVLAVSIIYGIAMIVGLIFLIVPGLIVMCSLWVAVPVAVVERPGIMRSLSRSAELTRGNRWGILGLLVCLGLTNAGIQAIAEEIFVTNDMSMTDLKIYLFVVVGVSMLIGAVAAIVNAFAYHDLRLASGDIDAHQLASVFD